MRRVVIGDRVDVGGCVGHVTAKVYTVVNSTLIPIISVAGRYCYPEGNDHDDWLFYYRENDLQQCAKDSRDCWLADKIEPMMRIPGQQIIQETLRT